MAQEKSVLVCLGDNRRIVKFSSAEEGLPIDKVIKTAFCDVLGGEVEHISILIQIEERYGRGLPHTTHFVHRIKTDILAVLTKKIHEGYVFTILDDVTHACIHFHVQSALLISTPLYKLVPCLQAQGCVPKLIHNLGQRTVCLVFYS